MPKLLHLIVACAENRVIGRDGRLPWRIPEDVDRFHAATAGQICVLGRICYESWPRATQDGRRPIVLTSHPLAPKRNAPPPTGVVPQTPTEGSRVPDEHPPITVGSLAEALSVAETLPGEVFLCGGQRVYEEALALDRPMRLHLTLVHATVPGDTFFPEWRHLPWREIARHESGDANYRYTFFTLEK